MTILTIFVIIPCLLLLPIPKPAKSLLVSIVMVAELAGIAVIIRTIIKRHRQWLSALWVIPLIFSLILLAPYANGKTHSLELELVAVLPTAQTPTDNSVLTFYDGCYMEGTLAEFQYHCSENLPKMDLETYTYICVVGGELSGATYNIWDSSDTIRIPWITGVYDGVAHCAEDDLCPYVYVYRTADVALDLPLICRDCEEHDHGQ